MLIHLYLIRHGEAKSEQEDPKMPLDEKGKEDSKRVAAFISSGHPLNIDRIYHSGKLRASQTAEIFARALAPETGVFETEGLKPTDDANIWARRLKGIEKNIALVGHLPHLAGSPPRSFREKPSRPS